MDGKSINKQVSGFPSIHAQHLLSRGRSNTSHLGSIPFIVIKFLLAALVSHFHCHFVSDISGCWLHYRLESSLPRALRLKDSRVNIGKLDTLRSHLCYKPFFLVSLSPSSGVTQCLFKARRLITQMGVLPGSLLACFAEIRTSS